MLNNQLVRKHRKNIPFEAKVSIGIVAFLLFMNIWPISPPM